MSARAAVAQSVGRLTVLLLWALVAWGALLLVSAVTDSFSEGSTAFARLLPTRGATVWGWLGALCVLLALGVGLVGGALVASRRVSRGEE